jgi:hypothetical protein
MVEASKFENYYLQIMNAEETLALGKATLRAAFVSPAAHTSEGDDMISRAFELGRRSLDLGLQEERLT